MAKKKPAPAKTVETIVHDDDKRKNIPTAEYQSVVKQEQQSPIRVAYERRNRDLYRRQGRV
jgi:adenine-specific DNA-methyltransferase